MFKKFKLKQMAVLATQLLKDNKDAFSKYNAEVIIKKQTDHMNVFRTDNGEYFIPYGILCVSTYRDDLGKLGLESVEEVAFCMNTILHIAKEKKVDPMIFLHEVFENITTYLRDGVYPHRNLDKFAVPC